MPCGFHAPQQELYQQFPSGCQFAVREEELLTVDDELWCPYHCPMTDKVGRPTEKTSWNTTQLQAFQDELDHRRRDALDQHHILGYCQLNQLQPQ